MERNWVLLLAIPSRTWCKSFRFLYSLSFLWIFSQSVTVFLTILTSGLQYFVQRFNYKKDLNRIEFITRKAKAAAWGPKMVPIKGQRKVIFYLSMVKRSCGASWQKSMEACR